MILIRISATLISRLMLNLRDPRETNPTQSLAYPLSHADIVFAVKPTSTAIGASARRVSPNCYDADWSVRYESVVTWYVCKCATHN